MTDSGKCYKHCFTGPSAVPKEVDLQQTTERFWKAFFAAGNKILIKFKVNSMQSSMVTKEASIINIRNDCYHVEFCRNSKLPNELCLKILLYS